LRASDWFDLEFVNHLLDGLPRDSQELGRPGSVATRERERLNQHGATKVVPRDMKGNLTDQVFEDRLEIEWLGQHLGERFTQ
jgi:hypothetical protein